MANLHAALKALGPVDYSDVPKSPKELDPYIADLLSQAELILESVPIPAPTDSDPAEPHVASNASEITLSAARSDAPAPEYASLQKEWGKPYKLGVKENPLLMSVYKLSGKDGRGAWFARRSVHEGIGFSRFKKSLQMEFEQSLAVEGPAGSGNVRGIGGETRVEEIDVPGRGKLEVYRLSAQFPGPTTPRDFVTMLITSDKALHLANGASGGGDSSAAPRHHMMISKPCNHPDTQPKDGFVRGSYESVEFIREVPRKPKASMSTTNLQSTAESKRISKISKEDRKDSIKSLPTGDLSKSEQSDAASSNEPDDSSEGNPVEWIMVTRSDPGGSVPRFMVERGTPGSICTDAKKFLDWACQTSPDKVAEASEASGTSVSSTKPAEPARPAVLTDRRESYQSWRGSRVAGVQDSESKQVAEPAQATHVDETTTQAANAHSTEADQSGYGGVVGAVSATLSAYAPQAVLDRLSGADAAPAAESKDVQVSHEPQSSIENEVPADDAASLASSTSFASAEDHLSSGESDTHTQSSKVSISKRSSHLSNHEKELAKLEERRAQITAKYTESRSKLDAHSTEQTAKEEVAHRKAIEKHEKEVQKQEEKYQKELRKLEQKQEKERLKIERKQKKQAEKDDKFRLVKERDEAKKALEIAKMEVEDLKKTVEELRMENTALVAKLGQAGIGTGTAH